MEPLDSSTRFVSQTQFGQYRTAKQRDDTKIIDGVMTANLPHLGGNGLEEEVTVQVPTVHSNSIAVESVLGEDEALLIFSPKPYSYETENQNSASGRGRGLLFMVRTQLFSDRDVLKNFVVQGTAA